MVEREDSKFQKAFRSLKHILLVRILIASSVITAVLTGVSFYKDYSTEMGELDGILTQVETVTIPTIGKYIWNRDDEAIVDQANSMVKLQEIAGITIGDEENKTLAER
ncbi:hypothetical protein N9W79_02505, partial [bacterium]|nr:hypothetical protein [bacterium]